MPGIELSPAAQHWVVVLLVWIGFSALAGLVVRVVLPVRRPSGAAGTIAIGIVGTAVGLLVLSFLTPQPVNPIGPVGFGAATAGTLVTVIIYQIFCFWTARREQEKPLSVLPPEQEGEMGARS